MSEEFTSTDLYRSSLAAMEHTARVLAERIKVKASARGKYMVKVEDAAFSAENTLSVETRGGKCLIKMIVGPDMRPILAFAPGDVEPAHRKGTKGLLDVMIDCYAALWEMTGFTQEQIDAIAETPTGRLFPDGWLMLHAITFGSDEVVQ